MKTVKPRKQRKRQYNAPLHKKRKWLASHLAENLLLKYDKRSIPVITGDEVEVMRGSFRGHKDKVASVHVKKQTIEIEGITTVKADGTKIAKPIHPSNVMITKLNLTDRWRRQKLERGLSETAKKEIEKEAEQQLKDQEREQKEKEQLEKEQEMDEELDEEVTTMQQPKPQEKEEKPEKKSEQQQTEKKETTPTSAQQQKAKKTVKKEGKSTPKKTSTPSKKTPTKTPSKPKTTKKEGKK